MRQDSLYRFKMGALDDPATIGVADEGLAMRGSGAGNLWAIRQGQCLQVWIETVDRGHAGEFGYGFVGVADSAAEGWNADEYGERWKSGIQLDEHWHTIYNDMN